MNVERTRILIVCTTDSMIWNFLRPHIMWLKDKGFVVECACSRTGFYFEELIKEGFKIYEIPFERNPFKFSNLKAYLKLSRLVENNNYGLIYCHEPVGGAIGRIVGKRRKKFVLYIAHGFHFFNKAPIKHWCLYFSFEYILSFFTNAIVTICDEDFKNSSYLHIKNRYKIPGIGVDFSRFNLKNKNLTRNEIRKEYCLDNEDTVLINVGELSIRKNQIVIIEAMHILNKPNIKLLVCGEGDQLYNLERIVNEYNLQKNVKFLGFRKDIPELLSAGDIFVFPSLWEGLGLAAIEAMYLGLPVIGSNRQGIKDYVLNEITGFLFEPSDSYQLAEKIEILVNNHALRNQMSRAAHDIVKKYSLENSLKNLEEIYKKENILEN